MVLSFAQGPGVTNISKHSHEQKYIEFLYKVSRVARGICLFSYEKVSWSPIKTYRYKGNARARGQLRQDKLPALETPRSH